MARNAISTKAGPGRKKVRKLRFGDNLLAAWATLRANELRAKRKAQGLPRDEHGALTLTGAEVQWTDMEPDSRHYELGGETGPEAFIKFTRRIWLAGVSAQRGY
jgi:hypothetical protein